MRGKDRESVVIRPVLELPHEIFDLLQAFDVDYLIVEPGEKVVANSPRISQLGLVKDNRINSEQILNLIKSVRRSGDMGQISLSLPRGPIGEGTHERRARALHVGEAGNVAVIVFDDSESQRLDATRRDFVANISHELKTPVSALELLSEAIKEADDDTESIKKFAEKIPKETKRLANFIQDIIDLTKIQSDNPLEKAEEISVASIIDEAIEVVESIADKNEVEIEVINHNPELLVSGDKKQLVTALKNLLLNAIYHTGNDKKVFIDVLKTTYFVEINVKDSGDGISPEDQLRIFERFYRVDTARSRQDGGSGIGLSLVKHISLNHGGRAMVESKLGFGATFTIQLPLKENI